MPPFCFVVLSNPAEDKDAEYNRWYDEQHLGDVLAVPGFIAARRYKIAKPDSKAPQKYLAIYEIETDDLKKTLKELYSRAGTPAMPLSDALDLRSVSATVFEAITPRVTRS